jgi:probable phosphoglycerate mutase
MGWVQGHVDEARFTRLGKREIRSAADLLAEEQVVAVYSSDLLRARRTALVIAGRLKCDLRMDPRLRERKFGIAEGVPWAEVPAAATGVSDGRVVDELARPPGGECLRDVYLRCLHFLHDLAGRSDDGDVVVVGHDGSTRMLKAIIGAHRVTGLSWESSPQDKVQPVALGRPLPLAAAS